MRPPALRAVPPRSPARRSPTRRCASPRSTRGSRRRRGRPEPSPPRRTRTAAAPATARLHRARELHPRRLPHHRGGGARARASTPASSRGCSGRRACSTPPRSARPGRQGIAQFMPGDRKLRGLADPSTRPRRSPPRPPTSPTSPAPTATSASRPSPTTAARRGPSASSPAPAACRPRPAPTSRRSPATRPRPGATRRPRRVDLALAGRRRFQAACVAHAATARFASSAPSRPLLPWGVVVASNRDRAGAERQVARLQNRHAAVLGGEPVSYTRGRRPGMPGELYVAQIGRATRGEADALCARLRAAGGDCMVLRN